MQGEPAARPTTLVLEGARVVPGEKVDISVVGALVVLEAMVLEDWGDWGWEGIEGGCWESEGAGEL